MILNAYMLLIIYARVGLTQLFIACLSCLLNVERENYQYKREWKSSTGIYVNRKGIRYVSRSFSVRCLVSLPYGKGLISTVTLSVVVPQAIAISLRNKIGDFAGSS